jgi:hypothetical protein
MSYLPPILDSSRSSQVVVWPSSVSVQVTSRGPDRGEAAAGAT